MKRLSYVLGILALAGATSSCLLLFPEDSEVLDVSGNITIEGEPLGNALVLVHVKNAGQRCHRDLGAYCSMQASTDESGHYIVEKTVDAEICDDITVDVSFTFLPMAESPIFELVGCGPHELDYDFDQ